MIFVYHKKSMVVRPSSVLSLGSAIKDLLKLYSSFDITYVDCRFLAGSTVNENAVDFAIVLQQIAHVRNMLRPLRP